MTRRPTTLAEDVAALRKHLERQPENVRTPLRYVDSLPDCVMCPESGAPLAAAEFDAKTNSGDRAYMCGPCFVEHGVGLGEGGLGVMLVPKGR